MLMVVMCKVLADLLGIDDPLFSAGVHQLEKASGNPSADVRLYAEIVRKSHMKSRELGLDPKDTTGKELYQALLELIKKHDAFLSKRLGVDDPSDTKAVLGSLKKFIDALEIPKTTWAIKPSIAKKLLKATPPKKLMKQLGYRSIDSMLKRENICELFLALRFIETEDWLTGFTKKYKHLTPGDFELRKIEVFLMTDNRWGKSAHDYVRKQHHNLTHMKEIGAIAILPLPVAKMPGVTIAVLPLLLHYVSEIRMYATLFKIQQVRPDFGDIIVSTLVHDPKNHTKVAGHDVHWRSVHRHFGKQNARSYPEMFEPHVQPEDLAWRKAEEVLYRIEPALHFWHDMDYVAVRSPNDIVSFSLMDMAVNYVNNLPYGKHIVSHFRASLWNEIFARYLGEPALEYQVIKQITHNTQNFTNSSLEELFL